MAKTPNHGYNTPAKGTQDWDKPVNANFEAIDTDVEIRDEGTPDDNGYDPADGAKYIDTQNGVVYIGDGNNWTATFAVPVGNANGIESLKGDLTGGTTLTDIAGDNLSIDNGTLNATGGGGGIQNLTGGDGIDPTDITDGDTLSAAWGDADDLGSSGGINDWSGAADLNASGTVTAAFVESLIGGDGLSPSSIGDGDTLSVMWEDANDLDSDGNLTGGIRSLTGGDGINPTDITDGDTISVALGEYLSIDTNAAIGFDAPAEWSGSGSNTVSGSNATVSGGDNNTASGNGATVAGGGLNEASGGDATVGGGSSNNATGIRATIGGGGANTASGIRATVPGGGRGAAENIDSFVWNDNTEYHNVPNAANDGLSSDETVAADDSDPTGANTFSVSATGGVRFITGSANNPNVTYIPGDSAGWTTTSSRAVKTNINPVAPQEALAGVDEMEIATWEYENEDGEGTGTTHLGPMAEDFHNAFDVGSSDEHINSINADGVALAAIQGLSAELDETREELAARDERIANLETTVETQREELLEKDERIADLETRLAAVEEQLGGEDN